MKMYLAILTRRWYVWALWLLAQAPFAVTAQNVSLEKANKQFELHAYNLAIKSYKSILEDDKNNATALQRLADSYFYTNNMAAAAEWYAKAAKQPTADATLPLNHAQTLLAMGKYDEAKKVLKTVDDTFSPAQVKALRESIDFAMEKKSYASNFIIKPVEVNTAASDFGAIAWQDKMIFSSTRTDLDKPALDAQLPNYGNKLFISALNGTKAAAPAPLKRELTNAALNEAFPSYSADGTTVVYTKNNFSEGTRLLSNTGIEMSIFLAQANTNGSWSEPKAFVHNSSGTSNGFAFLTPDANALYFASNREGGYGGYDIYVTRRDGETWSDPVNLGPLVNTAGDEITPYFYDNVLYFASTWHKGFGGYDIFKAETKNGTWSKIINLGPGINSSYDDYHYSYDTQKNIGFLTSNRAGKGNEDVYVLSRALRTYRFVVINAATHQPVADATIDLAGCGLGTYTTNADGKVSIEAADLPDGKVKVSRGGYRMHVFPLVAKDDDTYTIQLRAQENEYVGKLLAEGSRQAIGDVLIKSVEQKSGIVEETYSDEDGKYGLTMMPNATYVIKYSKAGYTDITKTLDTGDGRDKTVLGTTRLLHSQTNVHTNNNAANDDDADIADTAPTKKPTSKPKDSKKTPPAKKNTPAKPKETDTPAKSVATPPPPAKEPAVTAGFSVQLASVTDGKVELEKFAALATLGNIYEKFEGSSSKVRLGIFATRALADGALRQVKATGFSGAFIVAEKVTNEQIRTLKEKKTDSTPLPQPPPANTPPPPVATKEKEKPAPTSPATAAPVYKVRLAALKSTANIDKEALRPLGIIEEIKKDGVSILLLKSYPTVAAAQKVRDQAAKLGFPDAYIIIDEKGVLRKVN